MKHLYHTTMATNCLEKFIEERIKFEPTQYTIKKDLYEEYEDFTLKEEGIPLDKRAFGRKLYDKYGDKLERRRKRIDGDIKGIYQGIKIKERTVEEEVSKGIDRVINEIEEADEELGIKESIKIKLVMFLFTVAQMLASGSSEEEDEEE